MKAKAVVRVTLEIELLRPFPSDCKIADVFNQGAREALEKLNTCTFHDCKVQMMPDSVVVAVITEK